MGSLSEVDMGCHEHASGKYLAQCNKPVRVKLPSRKHVLPKPESSQSFVKMLIPQWQTADKPMAPRGRATQQSQDAKKTN